jgi:TolB-like protein
MTGIVSAVEVRAVAFALMLTVPLLLKPVDGAAQSMDPNGILDANRLSVVKIKVIGRETSGSRIPRDGSGVIIGSDGLIVTALHVIGQDSEWGTKTGGALDRTIEVTGLDANGIERGLGSAYATPVPGTDIALLRIGGTGYRTAAISDRPGAVLSSAVAILWDPGSTQPVPVEGALIPTEKPLHGNALTVRIPVQPGHSGSGLFGADKKLIGIITNQLSSSQALAVPVENFFWFLPPNIRPTSRAAPTNHVAIPPFDNVGEDKTIANLALDIPEALNQQLVSSYRSLVVVPSRTCKQFAKCGASQIAKELQAGLVVDGSYRRLPDGRLRVTVNLIDANLDRQLWSNNYDFARLDTRELAGQMVRQIGAVLNLPWGKVAEGVVAGTKDSHAYDSYLQGLAASMEVTLPNNRAAIGWLTDAVKQDPRFAQAHAALADAYVTKYWWNFSNDANNAKTAEQHAREALRLDPNLPEAHYALAYSLEAQGNRVEAAREYLASTRLDPHYVAGLNGVARYLLYLGEFDRALEKLQTIADIDPTVNVHVRRAMCFYFSGDLQDSLEETQQAELKAAGIDDLTLTAFLYVWLKDLDSAQRILERLRQQEPKPSMNIAEVQAWIHTARNEVPLARAQMEILKRRQAFGMSAEIATLYALQGDAEQAIDWLERAVRSGAPHYAWYRSDFFKALRGTPRYEAILGQLAKEYEPIRKEFASQ